jgi:hypothetical protein
MLHLPSEREPRSRDTSCGGISARLTSEADHCSARRPPRIACVLARETQRRTEGEPRVRL